MTTPIMIIINSSQACIFSMRLNIGCAKTSPLIIFANVFLSDKGKDLLKIVPFLRAKRNIKISYGISLALRHLPQMVKKCRHQRQTPTVGNFVLKKRGRRRLWGWVGTKKSISESCPPMIDRPDKKAGFCSCSAAFSDRASAKTHTNTKNTERKTTTNTKTTISV